MKSTKNKPLESEKSGEEESCEESSDDETVECLGKRGKHGAKSEVDIKTLIQDRNERKKLIPLTEWEKEQEIARRYDELLAQQQRDELLSTVSRSGETDSKVSQPSEPPRSPLKKSLVNTKETRKNSSDEGSSKSSGGSDRSQSAYGSESEGSTSDNESIESTAERKTPVGNKSSLTSATEGTKTDEYSKFRERLHSRDVQLFAEAADDDGPREASRWSDKRIEKALSEITLERLEAVRLSDKRLTFMLEHPRAEAYIVGAYVKLHKGVNARTIVPQQDGASISSSQSTTPGLYYAGKITTIQKDSVHPLMVVEGHPDMDCRSVTCSASDVVSEPFTVQDLEQYKAHLKAHCSPQLETLARALSKKAQQLTSFRFTDEDVEMILSEKRKAAATRPSENVTGNDKSGAQSFVSVKDLINRKAVVEMNIERMKGDLLDQNIKSQARLTKATKLRELECELQSVQQSLSDIKATTTQPGANKIRKVTEPSTGRVKTDAKASYNPWQRKTIVMKEKTALGVVAPPNELEKMSRPEQMKLLSEIMDLNREASSRLPNFRDLEPKLRKQTYYIPLSGATCNQKAFSNKEGKVYSLAEYRKEVQQRTQRLTAAQITR